MRPCITTVITDLDNTLYDWMGMWGAAFSAMLGVLVERSGVPQSTIEAEARVVHQRHGTTEYAFLIQALPCLQRKHPGKDLREVYGDAIQAFRDARARSLRLFLSVFETLVTKQDPYVPKLEEEARHLVPASHLGLRDLDRLGIKIPRLQTAIGMRSANIENVAAIGPLPTAHENGRIERLGRVPDRAREKSPMGAAPGKRQDEQHNNHKTAAHPAFRRLLLAGGRLGS